MPYRSMGRGTYIIDRCFPGVGRVRRASGAQDESTFRAVNNMLSHLWTAGRADVLEQIRDGKLHPLTA